MAKIIPTTKELFNQLVFDIESELGQEIPFLQKATFRVLSLVIAGSLSILYKYCSWSFEQQFVSKAGEDALTDWGNDWDKTRIASSPATLSLFLTGNEGELVPAGTRYIDNRSQVTYKQIDDVTIEGAATGTLVVSDVGGEIANLARDTILNFIIPIPNVDSKAVVALVVIAGVDIEDLEDFRGRILARIKDPPQGGSYADYILWGKELSFVNSVYPYSTDLPSGVDVYFSSTETETGEPTASEILLFKDKIFEPENRPATAIVNILPVKVVFFDVVVFKLISKDVNAERNVATALNEFFLGREPFVQNVTLKDKSIIKNSQITAQIQNALETNNDYFDYVEFRESDTFLIIETYELQKGEIAFMKNLNFNDG